MNNSTTTTTTTNKDATGTPISTTVVEQVDNWEREVATGWANFHQHLNNWLGHAVNIAKVGTFAAAAKALWTMAQHWI